MCNSRNYCLLSKLNVWCGVLSSKGQEVLAWSKKRERIFACGVGGGSALCWPCACEAELILPVPSIINGRCNEGGDEVDAAGNVDIDVAAAGDEGDGRFGRRWER